MKTTRQLLLGTAAWLFACAVPTILAQAFAPVATATNFVKFFGTVADADGKPVSDATVEYWHYSNSDMPLSRQLLPEMEKQTVTVGNDGTFSLEIPPAPGVLVAEKTGMAPVWRMLNSLPFAGSETNGKLVLTKPGVLSGLLVDESNKPVVNAEVYVSTAFAEKLHSGGVTAVNSIFGKPARQCFSVRTDSAGRFRMDNFPTSVNAMLAVDFPGKVLRSTDDENLSFEDAGCRAGQDDIKLVIEPAARIEGKLVTENGVQLPEAQITLLPDQPRGFRMDSRKPAQSAADGSFHFDAVAADSYRIQVSFGTNNTAGWVAEASSLSVSAGQTIRDVVIKIVQGALLEVTVLGPADRKPQSKANVTAFMDESQSHGMTDTNGVARMYLLPGEYRLSAFCQPRMTGQASVTVEAGKTNLAEIELTAPAAGQFGSGAAKKISGIIHTTNGQPAAGVVVQLVGSYMSNDENSTTDANGEFELQWMPRQFGQNDSTPCVLARDVDHNLAVAQDLEEDVTNLDLTLAPALTLAGRAECDGKPVINATAQLVFWTGRSGMWLRGLAVTNTPGRYEIPALPPGRRYGVIVTAPGYGQKQNNNLEVFADPGRQELDAVELKPANLKLAGQVLDADDKPVAHCYVNIYGEDQPSGNIRTDREGRFTFAKVCEGTIRLSANSQNAFGSVSAEGGDTNVVLRLGENTGYSSDSKMHKLKGVVTDPIGQPAANVQVAVFPNNGTRWTKTGTNGEYSLSWSLQPWQLQNGGPLLVLRDKAHNLACAEELPEDATNFNVTLKPALTVSGIVKNADGAPLIAAQVGFWLRAGNSYDQMDGQSVIPVSPEGRFEIKCLPPDAQYIVFASAKGFGKSQQSLQPEYESNRVDVGTFTLNHADRMIAGVVLKNDDKPASGVNVNLNGEGQPDGYMTTDSKGRFHFQVCEGQIRLFAYSQGGGGNAQATVEAGDTNIVMNLTSSSGGFQQAPRRASLKGNPLPDLTCVNLTAETVPAGQPVLLCLFDAGQRPSRHVMQLIEQKMDSLRQQHIVVLGVQAAVISDEIFDGWKSAVTISMPVGRVTEKSAKTKWATSLSVLPWLILTDSTHKVVAEGFSVDDLDAQVQKMAK